MAATSHLLSGGSSDVQDNGYKKIILKAHSILSFTTKFGTLVVPFHLWHRLEQLIRRFPRFYDGDLAKVFVQALAQINEQFEEKRSKAFIRKLICLQYFVRKKLMNKMQHASQRCVFAKTFKSTLDDKCVLSIALGVSALHLHELLEEKHIFKALSSFMPGIKVVPNSFYSWKEKDRNLLFCYLEIEKLRGTHFTPLEIKLLRNKLPVELKQGIQFLTPSLSLLYNQEEIYKSLIQLSQEQRVVADLPQVMISFQSQVQEVIRFNVVATRVQKTNGVPFKQLARLLPSSVRLVTQRMVTLGKVGKRVREGLIFLLEVDYDFFLKKNWSIDLRQARNYIAKAVEQMLGVFRDYNGGLLSQQDKQFEQIIVKFREKFGTFHPLMEEVFYSLSPPAFQTLISARTCLQVFALFTRLLPKEMAQDQFLIESRYDRKDGTGVLVIKMREFSLQGDFLKEVLDIQASNHSCFGFSTVEFEGHHYLFLIDVNPTLGLLKVCEEKIRSQKIGAETKLESKVLRLNFQEGDPISLNPHIGIDQRCRSVARALYEGLTRLDANGIPQPAAAEEIQISASQTQYTFLLRDHYWSNGEKVTAYDFEQTWKRALRFDSPYLRADYLFPIKNARRAKLGEIALDKVQIRVLGPQKLRVELQDPSPYFLHLTAHPAFSPLYKGEEEPTHFNGPYIVEKWEKDKLLHLTMNPYYWDKKQVPFEDIYIWMNKDERAVYESFKRGELDWVGEPYSVMTELVDPHDWIAHDVDRVWWIYLNTTSFPLTSASIRKALACAINREEIVETIGQHPLLSPIPQTQWPEYLQWDGNVDVALSFFEQGLRELGLTAEEFPELTFHYSDIPGQEYLARQIKKQIQKVLNIRVRIVKIEWNRLSVKLDRREFQLAGCLRSSPYFYPGSYLELFRDRSNIYNSTQWENQAYSSLLKQAQTLTDSRRRDELLKEAERILIEEMPVIGIFRHVYKYQLNSRIKNIVIAKNGDVDLKLISF